MNGNEDDTEVRVGTGYITHQLAKALETAASHEDAAARKRAEERGRKWHDVLAGMLDGTLAIGTRTPVTDLPEWVTPEVAHGGFATGRASAGGPLLPHETELARRTGVPAERGALFAYHLSEPGLAELNTLLDSGHYRVEAPEEAALLTVAWLLRAGARSRALTLLETLAPFSDRLRFAPRPADAPETDSAVVYRETVGEVRSTVAARPENTRVEAMRETLTVWNPFADEILSHWLETAENGRVAARTPEGWQERGASLLERYETLAEQHTRCTKHRRPKENIAILRAALAEAVAGRTLPPRQRGLLQHAVDSMVRRRGQPGSRAHSALRARQSADGARPSHRELARLVAGRLSGLPQQEGTPDTSPFVCPVTADEEPGTGVPAGTEIPEAIQRVVGRALSGPIDVLVERGTIPSAEVLAALVPRIAATTTTAAYPDEALSTLMAATYRAFRNRRSLLLLNLEHQVRIGELPWVRAVADYREDNDEAREHARATLVRIGEIALSGFPATALPNPLISELTALARAARIDVPLLEELAADIFMGTFSAKFLKAAKLAAHVLDGTLYARYYGIDYPAILAMSAEAPGSRDLPRSNARTAESFADLCRARAGHPRGNVAANGMVIEQAQILTTHNLAALVHPIGVSPNAGWPRLARHCFGAVCRIAERVPDLRDPLNAIKDAAYAWRHMLFYLSLCDPGAQESFLAWTDEEVRDQPARVAALLAPALAGLRHVAAGGHVGSDGTDGPGRRLLGWSTTGHWMRDLSMSLGA
ncbi:hypothetical protein F4561_004317 [Lipingzhangella halophila]|uniref:Uncharacterized protein n=1 Tax=Lipingzhangella halophila TaxID=1783352 RepID=A0A7W7RK66_9ACTN|nr:hypothetical protein [Lipingzhangella halophila]MBB4933497.1 hypothetical protein [Lipingzhangella halophila]